MDKCARKSGRRQFRRSPPYNGEETLTNPQQAPTARRKSFYTAAFYLLLISELIPIWIFRYVPSSDGPSHLFNSYVFLNYRHVPIFEQAFTLQVPTAGNLAGHGLAILLMSIGVPPEICEKLLVTLCIVALALAFRYAVLGIRPLHPAAPLLVMPFLYNWPLQMGFWSFSLGVPFVLVCIGMCLRYRGQWNLKRLCLLLLVAASVYVCHPIDWGVCVLVIALMTMCAEWRGWLQARDRRRAVIQTILPLAVFIPFVIPNLLFARQNELVVWDRIVSIRTLLWPLYTDTPLHLFETDGRAARVLFAILFLVSLANVWWKARARKIEYADILLGAAAVLLLMGIFCPARIGEGTYLGVRLLLFGYLVWTLWLGLTLSRRALPAFACVAVAFSLWILVARIPSWRIANYELAEVERLGKVISPNSYVCQMDFDEDTELVPPMGHAMDLPPDRKIVDLRDYEAGRNAFWTRFRPGYFLDENYLAAATRSNFEKAVETFESQTGKNVDYIMLTDLKAPADQTLRSILPKLASRYELVGAHQPIVAIYHLKS